MTEGRDRVRGSVIESLTIAASGGALMIGTLLPWAYYKRQTVSPGQSTDELLPATGGAFDGEIAFALGAIAIVLALVTKYRPSPVALSRRTLWSCRDTG